MIMGGSFVRTFNLTDEYSFKSGNSFFCRSFFVVKKYELFELFQLLGVGLRNVPSLEVPPTFNPNKELRNFTNAAIVPTYWYKNDQIKSEEISTVFLIFKSPLNQ